MYLVKNSLADALNHWGALIAKKCEFTSQNLKINHEVCQKLKSRNSTFHLNPSQQGSTPSRQINVFDLFGF